MTVTDAPHAAEDKRTRASQVLIPCTGQSYGRHAVLRSRADADNKAIARQLVQTELTQRERARDSLESSGPADMFEAKLQTLLTEATLDPDGLRRPLDQREQLRLS